MRKAIARISYLLTGPGEPDGFRVAETIAYEHPRLAAKFNLAMKAHPRERLAALGELSDADLEVLGGVIEAHS
jgi:hypothetical protein